MLQVWVSVSTIHCFMWHTLLLLTSMQLYPSPVSKMQLLESSRAMPKKKLRIIGHCTRGKKLGHKANKLVLHLPVWRVSSAVTTHPFMMATVSKTRELWCRDIIYKMANFLRNLSKKHCKSPVLIPINRGEIHCQSYSNIWYLSIRPSI